MKKNISNYTLNVGVKGFRRLSLLNDLVNPSSIEFINTVVDLKNKHVLEVGCGAGIMASKIAAKCRPHGSVLATDISNEQLELAKEIARRSHTKNINFMQISADNIDQINKQFDIIYFRFVLGHVSNALKIFQKVQALMHANSFLICEEIESVDNMFSEPPQMAFDWWRNALNCQIKANEGDFTVGKKISDYFKKMEFTITNSKSIQPIMHTSEIKQQLWLGIVEISPILIASGFATQAQISHMITELKKLANSPVIKIGFFNMRQIAAKKTTYLNLNPVIDERKQIHSKL